MAMATYNGERFLHKQLESLARQTLLPSELVVCDDGSTDGTMGILRRFAAHAPFPVRIYQNRTKMGYGPNFLRAAFLCSCSLIAFCDQDDVWLEQKLERCRAVLLETGSQLVIHSAEVVDKRLASLGSRTSKVRHPVRLDAADGRGWDTVLPRLGAALGLVRGCTCVFRSEMLHQIPPAPPLTGPAIGHETWLTFAAEATGSITLIPDVLVLYRQHGSNASGFSTAANLKQKLMGATKTTEAGFLFQAEKAVRCAGFLEEAARRTPELRPRLSRAEDWYKARAQSLRLRASFYAAKSSSLPTAIRRLFSLVLCGAYRSRSRGGQGFQGLGKDFIGLVLLQKSRSQQTIPRNQDKSSRAFPQLGTSAARKGEQ